MAQRCLLIKLKHENVILKQLKTIGEKVTAQRHPSHTVCRHNNKPHRCHHQTATDTNNSTNNRQLNSPLPSNNNKALNTAHNRSIKPQMRSSKLNHKPDSTHNSPFTPTTSQAVFRALQANKASLNKLTKRVN